MHESEVEGAIGVRKELGSRIGGTEFVGSGPETAMGVIEVGRRVGGGTEGAIGATDEVGRHVVRGTKRVFGGAEGAIVAEVDRAGTELFGVGAEDNGNGNRSPRGNGKMSTTSSAGEAQSSTGGKLTFVSPMVDLLRVFLLLLLSEVCAFF